MARVVGVWDPVVETVLVSDPVVEADCVCETVFVWLAVFVCEELVE